MGVNRVGKMEMGFTCVHIASPQVSHAGSNTHLHKLSSRSTQGATLHGGTEAEMPPIRIHLQSCLDGVT